MRKLTGSLTCVFMFLLTVTAQAQQQGRDYIESLRQQIADTRESIIEVELWTEMQDAASFVPEQSRCQFYLEEAERTRNSLENLNRRYQGRADDTYREQAQMLLSDNRNAVEEYRSCFGSVVAGRYEQIGAAGVYPYQAFTARYNELLDKYGEGNVGSVWSRLNEDLLVLEQELAEAENGTVVVAGTVDWTWYQVRLIRNNRELFVHEGDRVFVGDTITTGPRGRARILMDNACRRVATGSSSINIGSNARVRLTSPGFQHPDCERETTLLEHIEGALVVYFDIGRRQAWEQVRVKVGNTIIGVRGTEVAVTRDGASQTASVWVDHGDAYLEAGDREWPLIPGEVTRFDRGQITEQRRFDTSEYNRLIQATAERDDMTLDQALAARTAANRRHSLRVQRGERLPTGSEVRPRPVNPLVEARSQAIRDFDSLMAAYGERNWNTVLRHLRPEWRENVETDLRELGEAEVVARSNIPGEWYIGCFACATQERCEVAFRVVYENQSDTSYLFNYGLEPDRNSASANWMVVESTALEQVDYEQRVAACPNP